MMKANFTCFRRFIRRVARKQTPTAWPSVGFSVLSAVALSAAPAPGQPGPSAVAWEEKIEVASGDAYQGPWHMNESQFLYVDNPTVAINEDDPDETMDVKSLLRQVRVPSLVMHGTDDKQVPFAAGEYMAARIPEARLYPFRGPWPPATVHGDPGVLQRPPALPSDCRYSAATLMVRRKVPRPLEEPFTAPETRERARHQCANSKARSPRHWCGGCPSRRGSCGC